MTENKRFKLSYVCGDYGLIDNDDVENKWTDFYSMSENSEKNVQICINKMNELAEENEQSKMMIATLRNIVLENEDLEKENQYIKNTIQTMLNNERTEIGKSVLKQLWEIIQ